MAARKSTGKTLRFEVFKRDGFTCRYCGAQPPAVVLVVDHIIPVAEGGPTTIENLNTACEPCNQGKSSRPLGVVQPRPDADLLYLEAQQEAAELARYVSALAQKDEQLAAVVEALQGVWCSVSGLDWAPADRLVHQMLSRHSPEVVEGAFRDVAPKVASGYLKRHSWLGYAWAVARNVEAGQQDSPAADPERDEILNWEYAAWFDVDNYVAAVRAARARAPFGDSRFAPQSYEDWLWETAAMGFRRAALDIAKRAEEEVERFYDYKDERA